MVDIVNEVVSYDFSKIDGRNVTVLIKSGALQKKYKYVNGIKTDEAYFVGEFIVASGDLTGFDFNVKFETDFSDNLRPMAPVVIDFDEVGTKLWVRRSGDYASIQISFWGKGVRLIETP